MTNIDQKDNENKELYSNNNLKITQMDRNKKVVNHMEKNINIAASGSEPETLQNQYLATKIALENNQEPKKQQKLTQACNKARKALEKYYYEQNLPMLPLQIHEMTEDEDTLLIQKTKIGMAMRAVSRDFETAQLMGIKIIAFPVNGLKTNSAEILSACSLLESEYFEPDELKIITPAGIFFDAGIELKDLNGNTIPEGTENVYCLAGDTKLHALVKAAYTLNIRAQTGEGETVILRNVRIREFDNIREYGRYISMNNSLARRLRLQEKTEIAEMAEPGEFIRAVNKAIREYHLPGSIAMRIFNNNQAITPKNMRHIMQGSFESSGQYIKQGEEFINMIKEKFGEDCYKQYPFKAVLKLSESLSFESLVPVGLEKAMVLLQSLTPDDIAEIQRQTTTKAEILFSILNQKQTNQPG